MNRMPLRSAALAFLLCGATELYAAEGEGGGSLDFLWKVVNVVVLLYILYRFGRKPVSDVLQASAESAKRSLEEAREAERKVFAQLEEMKQKFQGLEQETAALVEQAKKDAEAEKVRMLEEGRTEVQRMTEHAKLVINQEYRKAEQELKEWVANETIRQAEAKVSEQMNEQQQAQLVQGYLKQLGESKEAA
ncbi:MAG TPA: hypothetical protein EYM25_08700 [Deltaproteobacteria bacterium]|nr:hypothetical protein [Deltaproteobacteria bacterium]